MTDAERFRVVLVEHCKVERYGVTSDLSLDLQLTTLALVADDLDCLFVPLTISDDMTAVGPLVREQMRLWVEAVTADLVREHDVVTRDKDASLWVVLAPPVTFDLRGTAHHVEAQLEKKAVQ